MNAGAQSLAQAQSRNRFTVAREQKNEPLRECVRGALKRYFEQMDGHHINGVYQMVLSEVEPPILQTVLDSCGGNQTRAAQMLGMSRSTLRKKLAQYGLKT
jgi:Fis family transcriptional regulator